ncbi:hypothetical protein ACWHAG_20525 [Streptomyces albidoflavus]
MSNESAGTGRFARVSLVLGRPVGRAAALCQHTGHLGTLHSPAALAVVQGVLGFAEERERDVDDVREFENLTSASHVWGHLPSEYMTLPDLGEASVAVADVLLSTASHRLQVAEPHVFRRTADRQEVGIRASLGWRSAQ